MTCKLYYWNAQALGEPIRLLLSYGNIEFEDCRINYKDWSKWKTTMPMGQIPVLEIDGKRLHQSIAICRYLGMKLGLAGNDGFENYEIDSIVDTINDFRQKISNVHYEDDFDVMASKRTLLNEETIPFYMRKLEETVMANNGHLALKRTTWADFYLLGIFNYLNAMSMMDLIADRPNLKKLLDETSSIKGVREWIEKRPQTTH